jgi:hypothetical protein
MTRRIVKRAFETVMSAAIVLAFASAGGAAQHIVIQSGSTDITAMAMATDPDAPRRPLRENVLVRLAHRTRSTAKAVWSLARPCWFHGATFT